MKFFDSYACILVCRCVQNVLCNMRRHPNAAHKANRLQTVDIQWHIWVRIIEIKYFPLIFSAIVHHSAYLPKNIIFNAIKISYF